MDLSIVNVSYADSNSIPRSYLIARFALVLHTGLQWWQHFHRVTPEIIHERENRVEEWRDSIKQVKFIKKEFLDFR